MTRRPHRRYSTNIAIRLRPNELNLLDAVADAQAMTRSEVVRGLVRGLAGKLVAADGGGSDEAWFSSPIHAA